MLAVAACGLVGAVIAPIGASAQQQNEIVLSVEFDGRQPNGDAPFAANTDGQHTPGQDDNNLNNVVLTNDSIGYRIDWNVNEVDGTTVTITATLPEGMSWLEDPSTVTGVPAGCADGPSSITGNTGRDLVCVTDDEHEGSNGVIHPEAAVGAQFDGTGLALQASIETDQAGPVDSNIVETFASGRPRADWIKGTDVLDSSDPPVVVAQEPSETYYDVPGPDGATLGRIYVYALRYVPVGGALGAEKLNDAVPIVIFDHAWDVPPGTVVANGLMPTTSTGAPRTACGAYDGEGAFPIGSTGTWVCNDVTAAAGHGYPVTEITISGHSTAPPPTTNGSLTPNSNGTMLAGQIALWIPEAAIQPYPTDAFNGISGKIDVVTASQDLLPIQVNGSSAAFDEAGVVNNFAYQKMDAIPTGGGPGRGFFHTVKYLEGPFRSFFVEDVNSGVIYESVDSRYTSRGGMGASVADGTDANYPGWGYRNGGTTWAMTPRGNILTVSAELETRQTRPTDTTFYDDPTSLCVNLDPTHQEIVSLPPVYDRAEADPNRHPFVFGPSYTVGGGTASPNAGPLAQVYIGGSVNYPYHVWSYTWAPATNLGPEIPYDLEFAAGVVAPSNNSTMNGVTCNQDDVDDRGWVDSGGDLSVFQTGTLADGTAVYGDITHVRLRAESASWLGPVGSRNRVWGASYQLNLNVRVKDSVTAQAAGQELFVYSSRAAGEWDPTTDNQPPTTDCMSNNFQNYQGDAADDNRYDPPGGWCNLPYTDNGASSTDLADTTMDFGGGGDTAWELSSGTAPNQYPRIVHADTVKIVEAQLAIGKSNLAGLNDVNQNGDLIEFEVKPRVVGSSLDTISDLVLTDTLPSFYEFVGFTQLPVTTLNENATTGPNNNGTPIAQPVCTNVGQVITCNFGTQVGGWSDVVGYEVRVRNTGPSQTITNTVSLTGNDAVSGDAKNPATSSARSFTAGPFEESGIIKFIDPHVGPCTLADDCSYITPDGNLRFELEVNNEGNVGLTNYRVIDVLPHLGDEVEMASLTLTGDGRTPESLFSGTIELISASAPGATVYYTSDNPNMISRDPDMSETVNTWCSSPAGGAAVIGAGACPAAIADVTGVYLDLGTLAKGETRTITLDLATLGNECDDVYTNNFGGRTDDILLPIRSNDVTATVGFCNPSIDIEKATNGLDSDTPDGAQIVAGDPVTWTYVVTNDGDVPLVNAAVSDSDPTVVVDCDVDGDGVLDGTNVIPLLLAGDIVTCESTGVAQDGPYTNTASVSGTPALPDFSTCGCDPDDPSTWPTDAADYSAPIDPVTGEPVMDDQEDEDPSHYTGVDLEPAIDIEKDTNGAQSDAAPGETLVAGQAVTWTYVVTNTGTAALLDATVTDTDSTGAAVAVDCDVDGDGVLDGTNVIPLLLPTQSVTCESTGTAGPGPYSNNASVSGNMATSNESCVCDPTDPSTWPTDPADFTEYVNPTTGEPSTVSDEDPSNYTGIEPGIDIEKDTNGAQSDTAPGETLNPGDPVTWTYVVTNTGGTALLDAVVDDSDPAVTPDCDVDGDGALDGTNVIPFMAVGGSVTCEATGTAVAGDYSNTASVSGDPALPDFDTCGCDASDPSTWPSDPADYSTPLGPDGNPIPPVTDEDDSHYTSQEPVGSLGGTLWDDANGDGVQDPGESSHAGVLIELFDENGDPVLDANGNPITATTDVNGNYVFPDLPPGKYRIKVTAPDGTVLTPGGGGDDDVNGDGLSGVIMVGAGEDVRGIDAGLVPAPPSLAFTGSRSTNTIFASVLMMVLGGLMLLGLRRREHAIALDR